MIIANPRYMKPIGPWYKHYNWSVIPHNIWKFVQLRWGGFKPFYYPILDGRKWIEGEIKFCDHCKLYQVPTNKKCPWCKHEL